MKLIYMVVGAARSAFPLDVEPDTYGGDLKKAIKEGNSHFFKDVDARQLRLYFARRSTDEWLSSSSDEVKALERGYKTESLVAFMKEEIQSTKIVGSAFVGAPSENVVHLLVAGVTTISCIISGSCAFAITMSDGALICGLKEAIKEKNPGTFKDVSAAKLQLYLARRNTGEWLSISPDEVKAMVRGDETESLVAFMKGELNPFTTVRSAFVGVPSGNVIHLLVAGVTTICCIVPGSSVFIIRASDSMLIYDRARAIKKKDPHALKDVSAIQLRLYLARQKILACGSPVRRTP